MAILPTRHAYSNGNRPVISTETLHLGRGSTGGACRLWRWKTGRVLGNVSLTQERGSVAHGKAIHVQGVNQNRRMWSPTVPRHQGETTQELRVEDVK